MGKQFLTILPIMLSLILQGNGSSTVQDAPEQEIVTESSISTQTLDTQVCVYNHKTGETMCLLMDEYLQGVVRGEMQGDYPMEALKAQAVAARTYVYYLKQTGASHPGGACVCTRSDCCQAWVAVDPNWIYYDRVRHAVESTSGVVVTYEGAPIKAMYFSSSGGHTEDYAAVWSDYSCAYLQGVPSLNEQAYNFTEDVFVQEFDNWTILSTLRSEGYPITCDSARLLDQITTIRRSETGRVISLVIDGVEIKGTDFRRCLGLRSTHFYFQRMSDGHIGIVTVGFGHGVGMSQCGAAALAEEGYLYDAILMYYYTDVNVEWMSFR